MYGEPRCGPGNITASPKEWYGKEELLLSQLAGSSIPEAASLNAWTSSIFSGITSIMRVLIVYRHVDKEPL